MRVLLAGSTGAIGQPLLRALGGRASDPWALSVVALVLVAATVARLRQVRFLT